MRKLPHIRCLRVITYVVNLTKSRFYKWMLLTGARGMRDILDIVGGVRGLWMGGVIVRVRDAPLFNYRILKTA